MSPCNTVKDIRESVQLEARDFWLELYHPEVDAMVTYLGPYIKMSESPIALRRAAPRIGQHNEEVYMGLLDLGRGPVRQIEGDRRHITAVIVGFVALSPGYPMANSREISPLFLVVSIT